MKKILLVLAIPLLMGASCSLFGGDKAKIDFTDFEKIEKTEDIDYETSLEKWNELKKQYNNSYIYKTTSASWVGSGSKTEIEVREGGIISKKYESWDPDSNVTESFIERGAEIDSHTNVSKAKTMDELYEECISEYLSVDSEKNDITFKTSEDGIMLYCGYWQGGCIDDCSVGINISGFQWLNN